MRRKHLKPTFHVESVLNIDLKELKDRGIKLILFDIDNTLSLYNSEKLADGAEEFIKKISDMGFCVALVSNNSRKRVDMIAKAVDVPAVHRAMKPLKVSYLKICKQFGLRPAEACMVGDQILSDIWGANRVNMVSVLVDKLSEDEAAVTKCKRKLENWILKSM